MQEKELEVAELQEKIKNLQEDRSSMHNRVTGLIDRIDEWEKVIDQEEGGQETDAKGEASRELSKKSSSLFNVRPGLSSKSVSR